jgi:hypothetical protein
LGEGLDVGLLGVTHGSFSKGHAGKAWLDTD